MYSGLYIIYAHMFSELDEYVYACFMDFKLYIMYMCIYFLDLMNMYVFWITTFLDFMIMHI